MFLLHPLVKLSIVGSLHDREVACSASDLKGSNFESCVWRALSSHSSHHPQEVLLAQFSLYVHKGGLKPDSFNIFFHGPWLIGADVRNYSLAPSIICGTEVRVMQRPIRDPRIMNVGPMWTQFSPAFSTVPQH